MSLIKDYSKNSNIEKFINILSRDQQIIYNLKNEEEISDKEALAKIIAEFFTSITKGGITIHDTMKNLYLKYDFDGSPLNDLAKEDDILIIHKDYDISLGDKKKKTKDIPFYLKYGNSRFGMYKSTADITKKMFKRKSVDINTTLSNSRLNKKPTNPNKSSQSLVSILYNQPKYRFGTRNETEMSFFFNSFTNLDIAKSYPIVNVSIKMPSIVDNGIFAKSFGTSTINQSLFGTISNTTENYDIFNAYDSKVVSHSDYTNKKPKEEVINGTGMNMSIFTMPQTVNNFNEKSIGQSKKDIVGGNRINPILNNTRPLATIKNIDLKSSPTYDLKGHKEGTLSLVVHDRSRLVDFAPFMKADLYGRHGAEIIIEYGWSHMDGEDPNNPKAQIINSMRVKEKYMIKQTSSTIGEDGQVNIKLSISLIGNNSFKTIVSSETEASLTVKQLNNSKQKIRNLLKELNEENKRINNKIRYDFDTVFANKVTLTTIPSQVQKMDDSTKKKLKYALNKIDKNFSFNIENISNYFNIVPEEILKKSEGQNKVKDNIEYNESYFLYIKEELIEFKKLCAELSEKIGTKIKSNSKKFDKIIKSPNQDPYMDKPLILKLNNINKKKKQDKLEKIIQSKTLDEYVSFGKIVTNFIGNEITSLGKFDEVQVVFHTVNEYAGCMSHNNIASFLINKKELKEFFVNDIYSPTRNISYSVEALFTRIIKEFIEKETQYCYGFRDISKKKGPNYKDVIKKRFEKLGIEKFKKPKIRLYLDCISPSVEETNNSKISDKTILRISFVDLQDDPYSSINDVIKQSADDNPIIKINKLLAKEKNNAKEHKNKNAFINNSINGIKKVLGDKVSTNKNGDIVISLEELKGIKERMKTLVPSVTLGTENSPVKKASATVSSAGDLATIIIQKGTQKYNVSGVKFDTDLPLRVIPSQVQLEMLGCPFINFGQYVFIDFLTGTNIDNTYVTTSINHSLSPGSFKTSVTFGQGSANAYGESYSGIENISKFLSEIDDKKNKILPKPIPSSNGDADDESTEENEIFKSAYFHQNKGYKYTNKEIEKLKKITITNELDKDKEFKSFVENKKPDALSSIKSYNEFLTKKLFQ